MNERLVSLGAALLVGTIPFAAARTPAPADNFTPVDRKYRGDKGRGNSSSLNRMLSRARRRG